LKVTRCRDQPFEVVDGVGFGLRRPFGGHSRVNRGARSRFRCHLTDLPGPGNRQTPTQRPSGRRIAGQARGSGCRYRKR
jgi:hypothetical protein